MNSEEVESNIRVGTAFENLPATAKQVSAKKVTGKYIFLKEKNTYVFNIPIVFSNLAIRRKSTINVSFT